MKNRPLILIILFPLLLLFEMTCGNPNKGNFDIEEIFIQEPLSDISSEIVLGGFGEKRSIRYFARIKISKKQLQVGDLKIPANGIKIHVDVPENGAKPTKKAKTRIEVIDNKNRSLVYNESGQVLNPIPKDFNIITDMYGVAEFSILFPLGYDYDFSFQVTAGSDYKDLIIFMRKDIHAPVVPINPNNTGSSTNTTTTGTNTSDDSAESSTTSQSTF